MRYIWQHIKDITGTYKGDIPLAHFLKNHFKQFPILGSRDRRTLTALAYTWYRVHKGVGNEELLNRLMNEWVEENKLLRVPLPDLLADVPFDADALFPFDMELSEGISRQQWLSSMLVQPDLFIRIRKDRGKIISLLNGHNIPFTSMGDNCLALPNGAKIDSILPEDAYAVQDASSQATGAFFAPKKNELWYDCCAGAGGKSLLLRDLEPGVLLTVSDKRESIIHNLMQRFRLYRQVLPAAHVVDVAGIPSLKKALGNQQFDNIICDAPCSGSGTWARTPEQLHFFNPDTIKDFAALQLSIAVNVSPHLKAGGRLIYITCSVFRQENESVVDEIIKQADLKLVSSALINGTSTKADSMFVAVLTR